MHLTVDLTFPANIDDVSAMLADESFVRWRAQRSTGSVHGAVEQADVTGTAETGFTVVMRRTLPDRHDPGAGPRRSWAHTSRSARPRHGRRRPTGRRTGTVAVEILGAPVRRHRHRRPGRSARRRDAPHLRGRRTGDGAAVRRGRSRRPRSAPSAPPSRPRPRRAATGSPASAQGRPEPPCSGRPCGRPSSDRAAHSGPAGSLTNRSPALATTSAFGTRFRNRNLAFVQPLPILRG